MLAAARGMRNGLGGGYNQDTHLRKGWDVKPASRLAGFKDLVREPRAMGLEHAFIEF